MNRKNISNQCTHRTSQQILQQFDGTGAFGISQLTLGQIQGHSNYNQRRKTSLKNTQHIPFNKLQPYLMSIHSTLVQNLRRKSIQRNLTEQQAILIESVKNNQNIQQFVSGILAIQTCVNQIAKQNTFTIISFIKATNLLLMNYKFLYFDYMQLKNNVRTSQSLTNSQNKQGTRNDGFLKFFDSLKFLGLIIKNYWNDFQQNNRQKQQSSTNSEIMQSLKQQVEKLQNLILFQPVSSQDKLKPTAMQFKNLEQKLVNLHNEQQHIIISQLQKQNNFLKWQIYQKQNTITQYQESIYNVDLSKYRENEEREDYWAKRVKFNNSYSQICDDELINHKCKSNIQRNNEAKGSERILQPSQTNFNQELSNHLSLLSKKMEQLEIQNRQLKQKLSKIKVNSYEQQNTEPIVGCNSNNRSNNNSSKKSKIQQSSYQSYEKYSNQQESHCPSSSQQKYDCLLNQIEQMKHIMMQLESKQETNKSVLQEKLKQISHNKLIMSQLEQKIRYNQHNQLKSAQMVQQLRKQTMLMNEEILLRDKEIQFFKNQLNKLNEQINFMNEDFIKQMEKYNTVFYKMSDQLSNTLMKLDAQSQDNFKLIQKNKKLQEQILKKQAVIVDIQTKIACADFRHGLILSPESKLQRKISKTKQIKANVKQLLSKRKQSNPKQKMQNQNFYNKRQNKQGQNYTPKKREETFSNTPTKRSKNIKNPIQEKNISNSKKTMTIKIQGNKLLPQVSDKKQENNRKSQLMIRIQNVKMQDRQNSPVKNQKLMQIAMQMAKRSDTNNINGLSPHFKK